MLSGQQVDTAVESQTTQCNMEVARASATCHAELPDEVENDDATDEEEEEEEEPEEEPDNETSDPDYIPRLETIQSLQSFTGGPLNLYHFIVGTYMYVFVKQICKFVKRCFQY